MQGLACVNAKISAMKTRPSSSDSENQAFTSALKQALSATPAQVRSANAAAKAKPFSSHTRFVPRPAKAS